MTDKLRLALIGCGGIACMHLNGINENAPRIRVTAVIDPDLVRAESYAAETGAIAYASLEEALQAEPFDAVDIMVPHHLHEELALMAFRAGKHVLLEKPIAPTLAAAQRILDAVVKVRQKFPDLVFMVAENAQYWPEIVLAKEMIDEGAIGEILTARSAFNAAFDPNSDSYKGEHPWRFDLVKTGGGIAIDGGSHWIRPLRMWMGEIQEVIGVIGHPLTQMEGESLVRALFRFQSGKVATFDALLAETVLAPEPLWRITGTKGEILIKDSGLWLFNAEYRDGRRVTESFGYAKSFGLELQDFSRVVLDGATPAVGPEYALGELCTALALYRSNTSGRWEPI